MQGLRQRTQFAILALVTTLPVGILAVTSSADIVTNLVNPCYTTGNLIKVSAGSCSSVAVVGMFEPVPEVLAQLALIQGGLLLGMALGVLGVLQSRPILLVACSSIFILESIPLVFGGEFVLALPPAVFFMWRANETGAFRKQAIAS